MRERRLIVRTIVCLLLASLPFLAEAEKRGREDEESICGRGCMWLNDLMRKKLLPLSGDLQAGAGRHVLCHRGLDRSSPLLLSHAWHRLAVTVTATPSDGLFVTVGNTSAAAQEDMAQAVPFSDQVPSLHFSLFEPSLCLGLGNSRDDASEVSYRFDARNVFMWRHPFLLGAGLALLSAAPFLSRSVMMHYGTGTLLGVVALVLVLLFLLSKLVPFKKSLFGVGVLAGGTSMFVYSLYWFFGHMADLARDMWQYLLAYIVVAGLISFGVVYRWGPVTNPRSLDLIQWFLQLVAVAMIFASAQVPELSIALVVASLLLHNLPLRYNPVYLLLLLLLFPFRIVAAIVSLPLRLFGRTPRPRLLTAEEFEEQGRRETGRELLKLRRHCRGHPDIWRKVSQLQDPRRFTDFLAGQDHVTGSERSDHEWSFVLDEESDSETDDGGTSERSLSNTSYSSGDSPTFVREARRSAIYATPPSSVREARRSGLHATPPSSPPRARSRYDSPRR